MTSCFHRSRTEVSWLPLVWIPWGPVTFLAIGRPETCICKVSSAHSNHEFKTFSTEVIRLHSPSMIPFFLIHHVVIFDDWACQSSILDFQQRSRPRCFFRRRPQPEATHPPTHSYVFCACTGYRYRRSTVCIYYIYIWYLQISVKTFHGQHSPSLCCLHAWILTPDAMSASDVTFMAPYLVELTTLVDSFSPWGCWWHSRAKHNPGGSATSIPFWWSEISHTSDSKVTISNIFVGILQTWMVCSPCVQWL